MDKAALAKESLVEQVKTIQRSDIGAKNAWWDFCDKNLGGVRDPNKHEAATLATFLNGFRSGAIKPVAAVGLGAGKGLGKGGMPPPALMAAMAQYFGGAGGGGGSGGGELQEFVKLGQRNSANWKQAWQTFCMLNGNSKFDPTKYDKAYIVSFIDYLGQVANEDLSVAAAGQGIVIEQQPSVTTGIKRPFEGGADAGASKRFNAGALAGLDPLKAGLVDRVKALQRTNEVAKLAWAQHCLESAGGVKDPSRHDAASLQSFLDLYGA